MAELTAAQEILRDGFSRIREIVEEVCDGLDQRQATYRPEAEANSIAWLLWHLARVEDDHVSEAAGVDQAWTTEGWYERFGLPFKPKAHGYGHTSEEVAAVQVESSLLQDYYLAVHGRTLAYIATLTDSDFARVVDEGWDPPVTLSMRLVSVLNDGTQHVGQAAYLRGLTDNLG